MNDERDELDRALAAGLSALAADGAAADDVLGSMRPRLRRARVRRRVAQAGTAAALVLVVGATVALAAQGGDAHHVQVVARPTTTPSISDNRSPISTSTSSLPAVTAPASHRGGAAPATNPATPSSPTSESHRGRDESQPTTTTAASDATHTYTSPGGSIVVRFARGTLTLISSTPADGYAAEVHDALAGDVEVRFRNPDHEWRILVRVDHGALAPEITEH